MHLSLTIILRSSLVTFIGAVLGAPPACASPAPAALERRVDNARFTYYDVGLGACGKTNQPSDFVRAARAAVLALRFAVLTEIPHRSSRWTSESVSFFDSSPP